MAWQYPLILIVRQIRHGSKIVEPTQCDTFQLHLSLFATTIANMQISGSSNNRPLAPVASSFVTISPHFPSHFVQVPILKSTHNHPQPETTKQKKTTKLYDDDGQRVQQTFIILLLFWVGRNFAIFAAATSLRLLFFRVHNPSWLRAT